MKVAGLFAGIGGFELGFAAAGGIPVLMADSDAAAQAVLRAQFPDVEIAADVRDLSALPSGVDVVTAGFPCQNLSMAGNKEGLGGTKSSVVDELFRLVEAANVPTIVIENVYFMLHLKGGLAMESIASRLEGLGFRWAYRVLDTIAFGLPQRRRRVYLVASRVIDPTEVLFSDETSPQSKQQPTLSTPLGFYWTEGRSGVGTTIDGIPPLKGGSSLGIASAPSVLFTDGAVLTPGIRSCEALQGFPAGWTSAAADLGRRPEGRLLGNAVSVPVAAWVAAKIGNPGRMLDFETSAIEPRRSWPDAAFNVGDGRRAIKASDKPISIPPASISAFRSPDWRTLSPRALSGFIGRAKEGNLRFPVGFIEALEAALADVRDRAA